MKKHTTLLLTTWGLLVTILTVYLFSAYQHEMQTNKLLTQSIALHKQAIANEAKSYQIINDCFVVNRGLCDPDEFKKMLTEQSNDADKIYSEIERIEKTK